MRLEALKRPVDAASLRAFRIFFGLVLFAGCVRFLASGWIEQLYGEPRFFFRYWGLEWVPIPPVWALYVLYAALAGLALLIAFGVAYRAAAALFFLGFAWTQLLDVTNYLNHYVLVALLALLLACLPDHRRQTVPAWQLWLVRFQVGVVYVFAGLAKLNEDWLLHAQPLNLWLSARVETPLVGPFLDEVWVAYLASWAGFLFDTTIVLWLSWRRSRAAAYLVLCAFHLATHVLFNIGMFPFIMTAAATIFFAPDWPRRWLPAAAPGTASSRGVSLAVAFCLVQLLVPLRHYLYPGDVSWNEEGMRFSWKVMLREKHGSVTYFVRLADGREVQVNPRRWLASRQEREMSSQPDLILQLAHHIARDFARRGHGAVEVRAEALVTLNGRPAAPMIDPTVDLAREEDGLARKRWILPAPESRPRLLEARR